MYASYESLINNLSIDVWFVWTIFVNLESEGVKKVVKMKFLAMHITNQYLRFDIFMVGNLLNIFMQHNLNI